MRGTDRAGLSRSGTPGKNRPACEMTYGVTVCCLCRTHPANSTRVQERRVESGTVCVLETWSSVCWCSIGLL